MFNNSAYLATGQYPPQNVYAYQDTESNHYQFTAQQNYWMKQTTNDGDPQIASGRGWLLERNGEPVPTLTLPSVYTGRSFLRQNPFTAPSSHQSAEPDLRAHLRHQEPLQYLQHYRSETGREEGYPLDQLGQLRLEPYMRQ
jgi:hypothetical protein